jgi:hypothetical protein
VLPVLLLRYKVSKEAEDGKPGDGKFLEVSCLSSDGVAILFVKVTVVGVVGYDLTVIVGQVHSEKLGTQCHQ